MKKLLSSLLCFAMVATLTACGGSGRADNTIIRAAVGGDFAFLDPAIVDDSITANALNQMYEGLYKLDKNGAAQPLLAEALPEISEDGLTYTIKLKSGITWSDGQALKAGDFIYAWKRASAMGTGTAYYSQFIDKIAGTGDGNTALASVDELKDFGAVAQDDNTIVIKLKEKCAYFTSLMTNTVFYPVREDFVKKGKSELKSDWADQLDVPTNGAFSATEINAKDQIVFTKNDKYYAADEVKVKTISIKVMSNSTTQTSGFQAGELDFATSVNNATVQKDETLKKQAYIIDPFVCNYFILVNAGQENKNAVLKDADIRKAISMAIDRDAVVEATGYGDYAYPLEKFIPKGIPGASGDFYEEVDEKYADYNLAEAKKIMESKGYSASNMLTLTYTYNDLPLHKDVVQSLQAVLKEAYIDLQAKVEEKETFFKHRDDGDFELARHAMTADFLDPMCYLSMYQGFKKAGNTVDDAKYEALLTEAEKLDGTERLQKLHEAEKYLVQTQNYVIPLFGYSDPILKASDLEGVQSSPEGHWDLTRAYYK